MIETIVTPKAPEPTIEEIREIKIEKEAQKWYDSLITEVTQEERQIESQKE